jgi:hypothetical protein
MSSGWSCELTFGGSTAAVLPGAGVEISQHARFIDTGGAGSRFDVFVGQQHAERTLPSMPQRYATRANAADGSNTASISRESAMRRTTE